MDFRKESGLVLIYIIYMIKFMYTNYNLGWSTLFFNLKWLKPYIYNDIKKIEYIQIYLLII